MQCLEMRSYRTFSVNGVMKVAHTTVSKVEMFPFGTVSIVWYENNMLVHEKGHLTFRYKSDSRPRKHSSLASHCRGIEDREREKQICSAARSNGYDGARISELA